MAYLPCICFSQFQPISVCLPQIPLYRNCSAQCSNLQRTSWKISTLGKLLFSLLWICRQLLILLTMPHSFTGLNIHLIYPVLSFLGFSHISVISRSYFVKIDLSSSPVTTILTGVPQGLVLGSLLFVLFISPNANVINPGQASNNLVSFHQYADDTQLYIGANSSFLVSQICFHRIMHPESSRLAFKQWSSPQLI